MRHKLDHKNWFITLGGSNQEFTLGLKVFLKHVYLLLVFYITPNPLLAVSIICNFCVHYTKLFPRI